MSGPICPDCGCPNCPGWEGGEIKDGNRCELCGWTGSLADAPRKRLHPESLKRFSSLVAQRKSGKIGVLRFTLSELLSNNKIDSLMNKVNAIIPGITSTNESGFLICEPPADDDQIHKMLHIKGIETVIRVDH